MLKCDEEMEKSRDRDQAYKHIAERERMQEKFSLRFAHTLTVTHRQRHTRSQYAQ